MCLLQWQESAPWKTNAQIEQYLNISGRLATLYADEMIRENLAFRGGMALHKLFLRPQSIYSEDIDLMQITAGPFGPFIDPISEKLAFLGKPKKKQKEQNNTLVFQFETFNIVKPVPEEIKQLLVIYIPESSRSWILLLNISTISW
jgi:hypothetical protein